MKPKLRREQILRAATTVFAAKGYHRASITDIIERSGIARGTFYLYFDGKREIFSELVDVLLARIINCMKRVELGPGSPPWTDQIKANMLRIATILIEESELTRILYNHAPGLDEDFDKKLREFYESLTHRTADALRLGQEMGLLRKNLDPVLAAHHLVGSVREVMYHFSATPGAGAKLSPMIDELMSYSTLGLLAPRPPAKAKKTKKR